MKADKLPEFYSTAPAEPLNSKFKKPDGMTWADLWSLVSYKVRNSEEEIILNFPDTGEISLKELRNNFMNSIPYIHANY